MTSKKWESYEAEDGEIKEKKRQCPKCGSGVFLAEHKDRWTCGNCQYTEFKD